MTVSHSQVPIARRAVLGGLVAGPVVASFASRAAAAAASIEPGEVHILVRGLSYVADPEGTALITADGRHWSPDGVITPLHFGEQSGDDTGDDSGIIQAAVDYAGVLAARNTWDRTLKGPFRMQVVVSGLNTLYHVSRPIVLSGRNRSMIVRDFSITAIRGNWSTSGGKGKVGDQKYRPARSDFIFHGKGRVTYVQYENLKLNCNDLCGGIQVLAHCRVINCLIKKCAGIGVLASAGDVWVDRCIIKQYDQNDAEYYDPAKYTGIGVMCEDTDLRVTQCVLSWLAECARIEGTNCTFAHCHIFNGCRGYLGSYPKRKGEVETRGDKLNAALSVYFGRIIDDSVDLAPRAYHAGIVVSGPASQDNSFDSLYFDNCHMEIYAHGVHFNEPKFGSKPNSTLWSAPVNYWFAIYPQKDGDVPQFVLDEVMLFVESRPKQMVAFKKHPGTGDDWALDYNALADTSYNYGNSDWGDRLKLDVPQVHLVNQPGSGIKPAVTYVAPRAGSMIGFADPGASRTNSFGGEGETLAPWQSGVKFRRGQRCYVGDNVYENITRGKKKAGRKQPGHTDGFASDGRLDWFYVGKRDLVPVRFGGHGDRARIAAPNGQVVIGAQDAPVFRGAEAHAVAIRTGDSGVTTPPPAAADDLSIEAGGDGGLSIAIPDGARASVTVSTPSDAARFQIEFDDAAGRINFLVGGVVVQTMGG
jgi:hypothetical protein